MCRALLIQTQDQLDQLMVEYQEMSKKLGKASEESLGEALESSEMENLKRANQALVQHCSKLESDVKSLNARLAEAEEAAESKQTRNVEMQDEMARLEKSLETMDILKAQVK